MAGILDKKHHCNLIWPYTHYKLVKTIVDLLYPLKNNYYKNLEWVTNKENTNHAMKQGRINTNPQNFEKTHVKNCEITSKQIDQFDKQGNFIKTWQSLQEIERQTGMFATNISQTCKGKYKTHYGYIWKYHKTSND